MSNNGACVCVRERTSRIERIQSHFKNARVETRVRYQFAEVAFAGEKFVSRFHRVDIRNFFAYFFT